MMRRSTKLEFLIYVTACTGLERNGPSSLMTSDDYARDHVLITCESLQLGLTRLYRDADGYGYGVRITRAGRLLAAGDINRAAEVLDSGRTLTRLSGSPPDGALATLLYPGSQGISLHGIAARQHAPEMMRGVATGHLVVADGVILAAVDRQPSISPAGWGRELRLQENAGPLPSSRAARHVGTRAG